MSAFLVKKSTLATILSVRIFFRGACTHTDTFYKQAVPTSSPKCGSFVRWESKKGKWSKRWLELKEHGLWLSKSEVGALQMLPHYFTKERCVQGKAEEFLCSLSGFDAYFVTRIHKAPKPFVFAVKSTEPISLFENTADYVHVFACSEENGRKWIEAILLARVS